jgi:uncharacterized protein (DUF1501 family)
MTSRDPITMPTLAHDPGLRRRLLAAAALAPVAGTVRLAVAAPAAAGADGTQAPRLAFVLLRGGMDGLSAVPAIGDPAFEAARGPLADFSALNSATLPLPGPYALHPLLPEVHAMLAQGDGLVLHAVGLPYRERSHFDAQQVLESGGSRPHELATGWLGRALAVGRGAPLRAVALETAVPLLLRGPVEVDSWAPGVLSEPAPDLVQRLQALYRNDPALGLALARARSLREEPGMAAGPLGRVAGAGRTAQAVAVARKAAEFLQRGSQVAVLELGGWDSHVNQATPNGAMSNSLRTLDAMLAALRLGLQEGGVWQRTVVVVATEFGREVAVNGTQGTDHGSGGAAFVLGGAVRGAAGGRVIADWPGLAPSQRSDGRDLRVTTDLRSALRPLLHQHLGIARAILDQQVLPGSAALPSLDILRG